jgi:hypothetical protein
VRLSILPFSHVVLVSRHTRTAMSGLMGGLVRGSGCRRNFFAALGTKPYGWPRASFFCGVKKYPLWKVVHAVLVLLPTTSRLIERRRALGRRRHGH